MNRRDVIPRTTSKDITAICAEVETHLFALAIRETLAWKENVENFKHTNGLSTQTSGQQQGPCYPNKIGQIDRVPHEQHPHSKLPISEPKIVENNKVPASLIVR